MRILHTSDWHLGQHFIGKSRADEHRAFFTWLVGQVSTQQIDAVIVAGDIFDTTTPPSYARELYNRFVVELQACDCTLIVLGGNHDSVATLEESRALLACLNTRVIPSVMTDAEQQVIVLNDRDGKPAAVLCAIPFIRARDVLTSEAGDSGQDKQQRLQQAIADHYQSIYQRARQRREHIGLALPIIATGHLTTVGASTSDSVRDIYIGSLEAFPASGFPPAEYIALGHLHQSQSVANCEHIRYSGSPIPLSFDESAQEKSVLLVEFDGDKLVGVDALVVPRFQPMASIRGDLHAIEQQLVQLSLNHQGELPVWLDILVSTQDYLTDLQRRIQALTEDMPVEVLSIRRDRRQLEPQMRQQARETLSELSITDVFERRLEQESWTDDEAQQRRLRLRNCFAETVARVQIGKEHQQDTQAISSVSSVPSDDLQPLSPSTTADSEILPP